MVKIEIYGENDRSNIAPTLPIQLSVAKHLFHSKEVLFDYRRYITLKLDVANLENEYKLSGLYSENLVEFDKWCWTLDLTTTFYCAIKLS